MSAPITSTFLNPAASYICDGLNVVCEDAKEYLDRHKNKYDIIIFNDVIEHFKKEEVMPLLDSIKESLKDGGCVITKTDNEANPFCGVSGSLTCVYSFHIRETHIF